MKAGDPPGPAEDDRSDALRLYQAFQVLNAEFKLLCTRWQLRNPWTVPLVINDHSDPRYDADIITALGKLHARADDLLRYGAQLLPGLDAYCGRLGVALAMLTSGDIAKFTAPAAGSYHDIWMELHEFILLSLGLAREAEDA